MATDFAKISCADDYMSSSEFEEYVEMRGGLLSNPCGLANPDSVRFWHKFDPVPSIAVTVAQYQHEVHHSWMLWEMQDTNCETDPANFVCSLTTGGAAEASYTDKKGASFSIEQFSSYLCEGYKVTPVSRYSPCWMQESSYMTIANPLPCGQGLLQRFIEKIDPTYLDPWTIMGANMGDIQEHLFNEFEEFPFCVESWIAQLVTYWQTAAVALPKYMGFIFTFSWTHSTYGFYPLCTHTDSGGLYEGFISAEAKKGFKGALDYTCDTSSCVTGCIPSDRRQLLSGDHAERDFERQLAYTAGSDDCFLECAKEICGVLDADGKPPTTR
jgi:hypothetical protein